MIKDIGFQYSVETYKNKDFVVSRNISWQTYTKLDFGRFIV